MAETVNVSQAPDGVSVQVNVADFPVKSVEGGEFLLDTVAYDI
jgi:hypothetical protein